MRQPGTLERTFAGMPVYSAAPGFGSMFASSLLGSVAGYVIGSAIADQLFNDDPAFADSHFAEHDAQVVDSGDFDAGGFDDGGGFDVSDV